MAERRVWEVVEFVGTPLGHFSLSVTTAVPLPSLPSNATRVIIRTKDNGIYWRDDGGTATSSSMYLLADETLVYDGDLTAFSMLAMTGTASVRVAYYNRF